MLFVSPSPGAAIDLAALGRFVKERVLEPPARPRVIEIIPEMPVTPVGKIFKPRLREIAAERAAREVIASALPDAEVVELRALTDPDRGLLLRARAPLALHQALRAELEKLPLAVAITLA